jgi:hypothetical protein
MNLRCVALALRVWDIAVGRRVARGRYGRGQLRAGRIVKSGME